jgi:hypothetical protein
VTGSLRTRDALLVAVGHIRETAVFFYANVIAIGVGVLLVVVMLSMSVGLSRYVASLMKGDVSAEMIEVTLDPASNSAPPINAATVERFETVVYVASITPSCNSVFAELRAGERNVFVSLASPERPDGGFETQHRRAISPPSSGVNGGRAYSPPVSSNATTLIIPETVYNQLGGQRSAILHVTRSGGEALDIPVVIGSVANATRFSRCYAPLPLMRRIRTWQESGRSAKDVFAGPDDDPAFVYDAALVYARSIDDVPAVRRELEKLGYRTASILDSVKRYRQILLIASVVLTSLGLIALFTGSVSIFNAAYAAVLRRSREFAIYKTYGATKQAIMTIVLTEAALTSLVAAILGFAAGGGVCALLQRLVRREVSAILFPVEWWLMLVAFAVAGLATLIASIIPALRAARLAPIEAMRA